MPRPSRSAAGERPSSGRRTNRRSHRRTRKERDRRSCRCSRVPGPRSAPTRCNPSRERKGRPSRSRSRSRRSTTHSRGLSRRMPREGRARSPAPPPRDGRSVARRTKGAASRRWAGGAASLESLERSWLGPAPAEPFASWDVTTEACGTWPDRLVAVHGQLRKTRLALRPSASLAFAVGRRARKSAAV